MTEKARFIQGCIKAYQYLQFSTGQMGGDLASKPFRKLVSCNFLHNGPWLLAPGKTEKMSTRCQSFFIFGARSGRINIFQFQKLSHGWHYMFTSLTKNLTWYELNVDQMSPNKSLYN